MSRNDFNLARVWGGVCVAAVLALLALPPASHALPARLVLALDGVAYRDMQALQAGITRTNFWGRTHGCARLPPPRGIFPSAA